ncbi:MAG: TraR/DksA family transcriptional regulator [Spirochaetota bacterium]
MTASFKKNMRSRLTELEEEILASIDDQRREYEELTLGDRTEETDEAAIRNDERAMSALLRHDRHRLVRVQSALARLEEGHFGVCAVCGEQINEKRLDAQPDTVFCYDCARKRQQSARQAHLN